MANADRLPYIKAEIDKLKGKYGKNSEFAEIIKKAPTAKDTSAADFMAKQKDFRDARYDLIERSKTEPSAVKRKELFNAYNDLAGIEKLINQTLEEGLEGRPQIKPGIIKNALPTHEISTARQPLGHLDEYRRINEGYKNQVFPLRENRIARKVMNGDPLSADIAHELAGNQEGQSVLREIALRNEEIKRNIVGQQYKKTKADKSSFYDLDETVREYTNRMPELNNLVDKRQNVINSFNESKSNLEKSKQLHNEARENNNVITKENERIQTEKQQKLKDIKSLEEKNDSLGGIKLKLAESSDKKTKLESYHKELSDLKIHQDTTHKSINEITKDLKTLDNHLENIKTAQKKLDLTSKPEKVKAQKTSNINKVKQEINDLTQKVSSLDNTIKKLQEASKKTELKLSKKIDIQRSLDEAKALRQEAGRKLKISAGVIGAIVGVKFHTDIKDYLTGK